MSSGSVSVDSGSSPADRGSVPGGPMSVPVIPANVLEAAGISQKLPKKSRGTGKFC